jgi:peroxiredoxin
MQHKYIPITIMVNYKSLSCHVNLRVLFLILIVLSCKESKQPGFVLQGTVKNMNDGEWLYFEDADSQLEQLIDSVQIKDNRFVFHTMLPEEPLHVVLRTKDWSQYRFLWLENKPMKFDALEDGFLKAKVIGSETEASAQMLRNSLIGISDIEAREKEIEFIITYPKSRVSAELLAMYCTSYGKSKTLGLFSLLSSENKGSKYGIIINNYLTLNKKAEIGDRYIDFEMTNIDGIPIKLSDFEGKTIYLDFWASWCAPCRKENPNLVKTYDKFHSTGLEIVAVSLDEKKKNWLNAIEADSLSWIHLNDYRGMGNKAALAYGVEGIPDNFLINKDGIIVARDLRGEALNKMLLQILVSQ